MKMKLDLISKITQEVKAIMSYHLVAVMQHFIVFPPPIKMTVKQKKQSANHWVCVSLRENETLTS